MSIILSLIIQLSISLGLVPQNFDQMSDQERIEYIREVSSDTLE